MMSVLWLSCNFDMVLGEGKHNIYLFYHLDQNSTRRRFYRKTKEGDIMTCRSRKGGVSWGQRAP